MNKRIITYIGRRGNPSLKHYYTDESGEFFTYKRVLVAAAKIGALVEITETGTGSVLLGGENAPKIVGYSEDKEQVARWEALSRVDVTQYHQRKREKEMNRDNPTPVERSINTLRRATLGMTKPQRAAFLGYLIEELA